MNIRAGPYRDIDGTGIRAQSAGEQRDPDHRHLLWPSFDNGFSLYDELTPAQLELSRQMVRYWGAFTARGAPEASGQPRGPGYPSGQLMSLRPGGQTQTISAGTFAAEHQCSFWDAGWPGTGHRPPVP